MSATAFEAAEVLEGVPFDDPIRSSPLVFRDTVRVRDASAVVRIVTSSGFFSPAEVEIAVELVEERLARGPASGYHFLFAEEGAETIGYACFGPVPLTESTFELYWIAVQQDRRRGGLGAALLAGAETAIQAMGGRDIYVDTSSRQQYEPTRAFYLAAGYRIAGEFPDFYAEGDGKVVLVKRVGG